MSIYKFGNYKYFDFLVSVNYKICDFHIIGENVRETDINEIAFYNQLLEDFFTKLNENPELDKIIESSLNLTGFLWLRQPFYDGNTRTLRILLKTIFNSIDYNLDLSNEEKEKSVIPLFYNEDETCTPKHITYLKRKLTKYK